MTAGRTPNYDKSPSVDVLRHRCAAGWDAIAARLREAISGTRTVVAIECYPGVNENEIAAELARRLRPALAVKTANAA